MIDKDMCEIRAIYYHKKTEEKDFREWVKKDFLFFVNEFGNNHLLVKLD